jgi:predicted transcriptional regulator
MDASRRAVNQSLVAKVVSGYVSKNRIPLLEIPALINTVYQSLLTLGRSPEPERPTASVPIRRSVTRNYVACLECGWRGRVLRRHLQAMHGLGREEYRRRWGLPFDHALVAPAYSESRSEMAKQFGLGRRGESSSGKSARRARRRGQDTQTRKPHLSAC